jgi:hypothetical protein
MPPVTTNHVTTDTSNPTDEKKKKLLELPVQGLQDWTHQHGPPDTIDVMVHHGREPPGRPPHTGSPGPSREHHHLLSIKRDMSKDMMDRPQTIRTSSPSNHGQPMPPSVNKQQRLQRRLSPEGPWNGRNYHGWHHISIDWTIPSKGGDISDVVKFKRRFVRVSNWIMKSDKGLLDQIDDHKIPILNAYQFHVLPT